MPNPEYTGGEILGLVLRTGRPHAVVEAMGLTRILIYWFEDNESSWEPEKWLEVVSAAPTPSIEP